MTIPGLGVAKDYLGHLTEEGRPSLALLQTYIDQTGPPDFNRLHKIIENGVVKTSPLTLLRRVGIMPTADQVAKAAAACCKQALLPEIARGIGAFGDELGGIAGNMYRGVATSPAVMDTVQNVKNVGHGIAEGVRGYHGQLLNKMKAFNTPEIFNTTTGEAVPPDARWSTILSGAPGESWDAITPAERLGKKLGPAAVGAGVAGLGAGSYQAARGLHHLLGSPPAAQQAASSDAANFL
jgi:hypothetical protein